MSILEVGGILISFLISHSAELASFIFVVVICIFFFFFFKVKKGKLKNLKKELCMLRGSLFLFWAIFFFLFFFTSYSNIKTRSWEFQNFRISNIWVGSVLSIWAACSNCVNMPIDSFPRSQRKIRLWLREGWGLLFLYPKRNHWRKCLFYHGAACPSIIRFFDRRDLL